MTGDARLVPLLLLGLGLACARHHAPAPPSPSLGYTPVVHWDSLPPCTLPLGLQRGRTLDFRTAGLRVTVPATANRRRVAPTDLAELWRDTVAGLWVSAGRGPVRFQSLGGTPLEFVSTQIRDSTGAEWFVSCDHCFHAAARCRAALAGGDAIVSTGPVINDFVSPGPASSWVPDNHVAVVAAWELGSGEWRWLAVEGRAALGIGRLNDIVRTVRLR